MVVWGIDPGKKGAFVCIEDGKIIKKYVMPLKKNPKRKTAKDIDLTWLCLLTYMVKEKGGIVYLEDIHAIYGTDKSTMFTMGRVFGNIEAALECHEIEVIYVQPKTWQKAVWKDQDIVIKDPTAKRKVKDTKATSLNAATRIFPDEDFLFGDREKKTRTRSKPHDGLVDASLIAHYGYVDSALRT